MATSIFVTGTDTGVGKTHIATALVAGFAARGLRTAGMKPVASGSEHSAQGLRNDDALQLLRASNVPLTYEEVNPYCFAPPIAPHLAAQAAGVAIDVSRLLAAHHVLAARAERVIVEGAGGWRVPLNHQHYFSELPRKAGMAVLLVVGLRLGCINHAVLSAEAIRADGVPLIGWVGNHIDPEFALAAENIATLRARLPAPCWGIVPFQRQSSTAAATAALLSLPD